MAADAGRKRRLPTWMLGANAVDKPESFGNRDEKSITGKEQSEITNAKAKVGLITEIPEPSGSKRAEKSQIDEPKERSRKASKRNDDASSSIISSDEVFQSKKKLKKERDWRKQTTTRKQNKKSRGSKNGEVEGISEGSSGDEIELTAGDLLSIAEEYVNADREKRHGRVLSESTGCSLALSRCTTKSSSHLNGIGSEEKEVSTTENFPTNIISRCPTARCSSDQSATGKKGTEIPTTSNIDIKVTSTGDTAQDMLDLFLGPLLKKPPSEEQHFRGNEAESFTLVPESGKQVRSISEGNEEVPLTKKKSSLKDKVSVFFN